MRRSRLTVIALPIALVVVSALAIAATSAGDDKPFRLSAVFDQAYGLTPGGVVSSGGVAVGRIDKIAIGPGGLPVVDMELNSGVVVNRGASADLRQFSNSGELNRFIDITAGAGSPLSSGSTIPAGQTDQPVELDDVLGTLDSATRRDLQATISALDGSTADLGPALARALDHSVGGLRSTSDVLGQIGADERALTTLIGQGRALAGAIRQDPGSLGRAVDSTSATLRSAGENAAALSRAVSTLPSALGSAGSALDRLRAATPQLRTLVRATGPTVDELAPTLRLLRPVLADARPTLAALRLLARRAPRQLAPVPELLRVGTKVIRPLTPVLGRVLPITNLVRVYTPEAAAAITNWAGMSAFYDANGHGFRLAPLITPTANASVAPDEFKAGYLPAPFRRDPGALAREPWRDFSKSYLELGSTP